MAVLSQRFDSRHRFPYRCSSFSVDERYVWARHSVAWYLTWNVGTLDYDSKNGPILPWLRTVDAFNTHDEAFQLAIAGGVTTVLVSPGSSSVIGGHIYSSSLQTSLIWPCRWRSIHDEIAKTGKSVRVVYARRTARKPQGTPLQRFVGRAYKVAPHDVCPPIIGCIY